LYEVDFQQGKKVFEEQKWVSNIGKRQPAISMTSISINDF